MIEQSKNLVVASGEVGAIELKLECPSAFWFRCRKAKHKIWECERSNFNQIVGGEVSVGWKIIKKRIPLPSADFAITGIEI